MIIMIVEMYFNQLWKVHMIMLKKTIWMFLYLYFYIPSNRYYTIVYALFQMNMSNRFRSGDLGGRLTVLVQI